VQPTWRDFDGRYVVVSGSVGGADARPIEPLVIDLGGPEPSAARIEVTGVATLDRHGAQAVAR
jgi:hypothetical protein